MNKITINNQDFVETNEIYPISDGLYYKNKWYKPVEQFKVGDWVYCNNSKSIFKHTIYDNNLKRLRKATSQEILEHLRTIAKEKGLVKGAKVKGIQSNSELLLHTIVQEDDDYYPESDEYAKSGIILYSNGKWVEKIEEPKFTFGGHEVSFKVKLLGDTKGLNDEIYYDKKTVEVTCKRETGTHWQIEEILKNYFRPCKFGNVEVKSFEYFEVIKFKKELKTFKAEESINYIDKITIGCLTGTYKELYNIYQHCLTLLK